MTRDSTENLRQNVSRWLPPALAVSYLVSMTDVLPRYAVEFAEPLRDNQREFIDNLLTLYPGPQQLRLDTYANDRVAVIGVYGRGLALHAPEWLANVFGPQVPYVGGVYLRPGDEPPHGRLTVLNTPTDEDLGRLVQALNALACVVDVETGPEFNVIRLQIDPDAPLDEVVLALSQDPKMASIINLAVVADYRPEL